MFKTLCRCLFPLALEHVKCWRSFARPSLHLSPSANSHACWWICLHFRHAMWKFLNEISHLIAVRNVNILSKLPSSSHRTYLQMWHCQPQHQHGLRRLRHKAHAIISSDNANSSPEVIYLIRCWFRWGCNRIMRNTLSVWASNAQTRNYLHFVHMSYAHRTSYNAHAIIYLLHK